MTDWDRFGRSIAERQDRTLAGERPLAQAREKLVSTMAAPPVRRARPWLVFSGLAFAVAGTAVVLLLAHRNSSPLQVTVGQSGHMAALGSFIAASPSEALPIHFSDGSSLLLAPASAARVTETGAHGAHVVLESGHVEVTVVHRSGAEWHLRAGPFNVAVTGTRFDLEWKSAPGELSLLMREGRVLVSDGCLAHPQELTTGEHLTVSTRTSRWEVTSGDGIVAASPTELATAASSDPAPPSELPAPVMAVPAAERAATIGNAPSGLAGPESWRDSLARGEYREAVAKLDENAWTQALQTGTAADLMALANAARLSDDFNHATQCLLRLRRRFPRDSEAKVAAFTLGRMAFDHSHAYSDSAAWFRRYLAEAPTGDLAREASGRLIEAYTLSGKRLEADEAARKYLREYPSGPHADLARHELSQP